MMIPEVSIIIPTVDYFSRKERIKNILSALERQSIAARFEVIIVDNELQYNYVRPYRLSDLATVISEPKRGLSRARNAGVVAATGKIIAFLDDDAIPHRTWLEGIVRTHGLPRVLCVGGPVVLEDRGVVRWPKWFSDYFLRFIVPPRFPDSTGVVVASYYIIGANMSFKSNVFKDYGIFDVSLGRRGDCLLSGEDMEFMMRFKPEALFYEPLAAVSTKITAERLTRWYFTRRIFWQAVSDARIFAKHGSSGYYDRSELFFSRQFRNNLLVAIRCGRIFEAFCMMIRIVTFKVVSCFYL